jgi:hypothetical protein
MRKLGSAYTIAVGLMLLAAPAYAQDDYPPDSDAGLTVSESTVSPGESFTVSGDGAAPGATATSGGEVLGVATIRVVVAAAAGALPFTGGNVAPGLGVGIALILAGGLLLVAIRRRRTATA